MSCCVLVTGGAGYIGSHTCKALAAVGYEPVVFDDLSAGYRQLVRWGPIVEGSICDSAAISRALARYSPLAVIHFAGRIAVGESVASPWLHYATNVTGSIALIDAMRQHSVHNLVFSSSAAVYGLPQAAAVAEDAPPCPISPYGRSKAMVEQVISDHAAAGVLRAVSLRYFNAAGADADGELGELHNPETHLIPLAIDAALNRTRRITVYGDDYDTPDGTCVRDYVHVSDLALAHVRAVEMLVAGDMLPAALNVGTGVGYSVREVIDMVGRIAQADVPRTLGARRLGDPARLVADPALAMRTLRWRPQHSSLDNIVATAWRWHQSPCAATLRSR